MDDKEKTGKLVQKRGQTGAGRCGVAQGLPSTDLSKCASVCRGPPLAPRVTGKGERVDAHMPPSRLRPVLALDFQMPPRKHAVLYHSIEIIKTTHFGNSPHFVQFYALASAGWTIRSSCIVSAVTQTSSVAGSEKTAVFCFPIELVLESDGVPSSSHPPLTLFFSVMSVDMWERHRQLGYAHFSPRSESGYSTCQVGFWRVAETRESAMHTFFVGGIEEASYRYHMSS